MNLNELHEPFLFKKGFHKTSLCKNFNSMGNCYALDSSIGHGSYWIYSHKDLFAIVLHDFYFNKDFYFNDELAEYFSISYFESASGEELHPYRRINVGCIKSYWSHSNYEAIFHKKIPIKSIGIEFTPKYCDKYLSTKYPDNYINPRNALLDINETTNFPEMLLLLNQLKNYKGTGISAELFFEAKATEAISLIIDREIEKKSKKSLPISKLDMAHIESVASYINDHYANNLTLNQLSKIACMGTTKLKITFKSVYKSSITRYIQNRRMEQAEYLLSNTDLDIKQIALIIGYSSASHFSELFKRSTSLKPTLYRNLSKNF